MVMELLKFCIAEIMRSVRTKFTDDLISMGILEKVRLERRHSASDIIGELDGDEGRPNNRPGESRKKFKNRILTDLQYTQFKRKTVAEALNGYYKWISAFLDCY